MPAIRFPNSLQPPLGPLPWEPGLTQLRQLSGPDLDRLVTTWLQRRGLRPSRRIERTAGAVTYQALSGRYPTAFPLAVRIHQRESRLQAHHVEAFAGALQARGIPAGVLITTGGCTAEAITTASATRGPHVRLLSGPQWLHDLAATGTGIHPRRLLRWVLDLWSGRHQSGWDDPDSGV